MHSIHNPHVISTFRYLFTIIEIFFELGYFHFYFFSKDSYPIFNFFIDIIIY